MTSLPPPVQSVLELFQGPLAGVRFADIEGAVLARLAAEVEAASSEVRAHEGKLAELRQTLAQRQEALLALAQLALAYARVYAEGDESLLDAVNRISLPRAAKPRKAPLSKGTTTRGDALGEADGVELAGELAPASDVMPRDGDDAAAGANPAPSADVPTLHAPHAGEADASRAAVAPVRGARKGRAAAQRTAN